MKRALTGIQSSGEIHVGNYLGAIKPALELQQNYHCLYFIADLHALTTLKDAHLMHSYTMDSTATWLALGLDVSKHLFYRQSDVPMVTEFAWYLSCFTGIGFLEKAHAYKDARAKGEEINHGVVAYPILMAADIVMYDVDVVPVGKDQKQHLEMTRDIAGYVNAGVGKEVIKLPQALIRENVAVVPGLDGRKMSKSYGNGVPIFCDEKTMKSKIMSIKTDSTPLEEPKELDHTLVGQFYKYFTTQAQYQDLKTRLSSGGLGWGHAKEELFEVIFNYFKPSRAEYLKLRGDERHLNSVLVRGAEQAKEIAMPQLLRLRQVLGLSV